MRMEAGDTTGARASDLETSEEQPLTCPPACEADGSALPLPGPLNGQGFAAVLGPDPR